MAKKKAASSRKKAEKKPAINKHKKKTGAGKAAIPAGKKPATKKTASKKAAKKKPVRKPPKAARKRLGRPKVTADARLDILFQKDYQVREVFAFLNVETVRELEQHSPQDIIQQMTRPLVQTVDRIRKALAMSNRCLSGDNAFALEFLERL